MKKTLLILVLVLVMGCLLSLVAFATEVTDKELTYTLTKGETEADNTAKIISHRGKTFTETDIIIPAYVEYNGEQYRVIGTEDERAFQDTNITSVVFDDDIRWDLLSPHTFQSCGSLTTIDFGQSEIKKIGGYAFYNSKKLVLANNRMPNGLEELVDDLHFTNCKAMETLIFPESFTRFSADLDTAMSSSGILNLVFEGEMEYVYIRYINKSSLGGINIYLTKNTVSQLNGNYLETLVYDNTLYIKDGDYSTKTDGSLSFTLSANTTTSSGKELTLDGATYSKLNKNHDRIYFCADKKVAFIVGMLTSGRFAVFEENALKIEGDTNPNVTNKLVPHFEKETIVEEANCLHGKGSVTYCYCGYIMAQETDDVLGEHTYKDDGDCTTECLCTVCNGMMIEARQHIIKEVITYLNGFLNEGEKTGACSNEGCLINITPEITKPLFVCLGYSAPEDGRGGIAIGFTVNNEAIAEYEEITGKTLKYGVFAVLQSRLGNNDVFADDGTAAKGVISAEITNYQFVAFELKIVGFTDEQKDTKLAMGAYVAVTDGETTEYSYMQGGEPNENEKYCFVSYNDVVNAPSTDEEVTQ